MLLDIEVLLSQLLDTFPSWEGVGKIRKTCLSRIIPFEHLSTEATSRYAIVLKHAPPPVWHHREFHDKHHLLLLLSRVCGSSGIVPKVSFMNSLDFLVGVVHHERIDTKQGIVYLVDSNFEEPQDARHACGACRTRSPYCLTSSKKVIVISGDRGRKNAVFETSF